MRGLSLFVAAGALLAGSALSAQAMPIAAPAPGADAAPAALVKVADGCGPGRFRGVGGYCEGHRPITVRRVCRVEGYPGAMVRRCHTERIRALPYHPHLGPRY